MKDCPKATSCFVAMFDIIGWKALRSALGTSALAQRYARGILPMIHHAAAGSGEVKVVDGESAYVPRLTEISVGVRQISDTVIFFAPDDSFESFLGMVHSSFVLLQSGFAGLKAPYRGAIGHGDLVCDEHLMIGSAVEDAYRGESSQVWAGAMLTEQCRDFVVSQDYVARHRELLLKAAEQETEPARRRLISDACFRLVEFDVPLQRNPKSGPVQYSSLRTYAIDWTLRMFDAAAEKSFSPTGDAHAQRIKRNTVEFEAWAKQDNRVLPILPSTV